MKSNFHKDSNDFIDSFIKKQSVSMNSSVSVSASASNSTKSINSYDTMKYSEHDDDDDYSSDESVQNGNNNRHEFENEKAKYKAKNREHAKNTRRRKKGYIDTLRLSLASICSEREQIDTDRRVVLARLAEQVTLRKQVLQTFFNYRAKGELSYNIWKSILDESFEMTLPITPYRTFAPLQVFQCRRHVKGIKDLISDTASFSTMIQSIVTLHDFSSGNRVIIDFSIDFNEMIVNKNILSTKVILKTLNAISLGARYELNIDCLLLAHYNSTNKLVLLDVHYDVMSLMQQLRRSSRRHEFQVVPNTLHIAEEYSNEARLALDCRNPFQIIYSNKSFLEMFGYDYDSLLKMNCSMIIADSYENNNDCNNSNNEDFRSISTGVTTTSGNSSSLSFNKTDFLSKIENVVKTGNPSLGFISMIPSSGDIKSMIKCQVKIYPLYSSTELSPFVVNVLLVIELLPELTRQSYLQYDTQNTNANTSTKARKHATSTVTNTSRTSAMSALTSNTFGNGLHNNTTNSMQGFKQDEMRSKTSDQGNENMNEEESEYAFFDSIAYDQMGSESGSEDWMDHNGFSAENSTQPSLQQHEYDF